MSDIRADVEHLRRLAAKCRRLGSSLTDSGDVASVRQMAAEYEAMANRIEQPKMPNPQPPFSL